MFKKSIFNLTLGLNHILQLSTIFGLGYLQLLTKSKALVMRHIFQRRLEFESHFLSNYGIIIQSTIIIVLTISVAYYLYYIMKNQETFLLRVEVALSILIKILGLLVIHLSFFKNLLSYGYFIMGFYLVLIIQYMNIKLINNKNMKEKR